MHKLHHDATCKAAAEGAIVDGIVDLDFIDQILHSSSLKRQPFPGNPVSP